MGWHLNEMGRPIYNANHDVPAVMLGNITPEDIARESEKTAKIGLLAEHVMDHMPECPSEHEREYASLVQKMGTMEEDFMLTYDTHGSKCVDIVVKPTLDTEQPRYLHTLIRIATLLQHTLIKRVMTIGCPDETFFKVVPACKCMWVYLRPEAEAEWQGCELV